MTSKEKKNLKEKPYQELLGKEVDFFFEGKIERFIIYKITVDYFILRKKDNNRIIDLEVPIIEVLSLNFSESEEYEFSIEEWKNFWLKYGGYFSPNFKITKERLSIKEAREIFSQLPSQFEAILFYYLLPNRRIYSIFSDLHIRNIIFYLESYVDISSIKNFIFLYYLIKYNLNTLQINNDEAFRQEREKSIKRNKFFGRIEEIELKDEKERDDFLSKTPDEIIDYFRRLLNIRRYFLDVQPQFYEKIAEIRRELDERNQLSGISSISFFQEIIDPHLYPQNIFENDEYLSDLNDYFIVIFIKNYLLLESHLEKLTFPIENFILNKILFRGTLSKFLKIKPQFIILPTVNPVPSAYFYKYLLFFTKKLLMVSNPALAQKIVIPKFILFDFIDRAIFRVLLSIKDNSSSGFQFLFNLFTEHSLEEIEKKIGEEDLNLSKENKIKLSIIIKHIKRVKLKLSKFIQTEKNNSLEFFINSLFFLDDALSEGYSYFFSMLILSLALVDIFRNIIDPNEILSLFKERFSFKFNEDGEIDLKEVRRNENLFFTSHNLFKEFIPFFKFHRLTNGSYLTSTYYPGFIYEEMGEFFNKEIIEKFVRLSQRKITILKLLAKKLSPFLAQMIIANPDLV
ncbi:MAG: hypothetical protein NZ866_00555 [Patescibacteria group bacterium]|nr:hypothetical protein [Patescibacteria group bacterium]